MFGRKISWASALSQFSFTLRRFPITLLLVVTGTVAALILTEAATDQVRFTELRLLLTAGIGAGLFLSMELGFARYKPALLLRLVLSAAGILLLSVFYLWLPPKPTERQAIQTVLLFIGFVLSATYIAYLNWLKTNGFWQFNRIVFTRAIIGGVFSLVLFVGLTVALLAINELFRLDIRNENYMRLWILVVGLFFPFYLLSGVPRGLIKLQRLQRYPKVLRVFSLYLLLPLVTIYFLILYAYVIRIIWFWKWPEGWVANLVLGFSLAGIAAFLLTYPLRKSNANKWVMWFGRWFFVVMLPLVVLLLLAIWRRISEYGITENRYLVLLSGMWLLVLCLYYMFSTRRNIKFIPVTLSLLALLSAFGPWSVFSVSDKSQFNRLKTLLDNAGLLHQNRWQLAESEIPTDWQYQISTVLDYFEQRDQLESLKPLLGNRLDSIVHHHDFVNKPQVSREIMDQMGLQYQPYPAPLKRDYFSYIAKPDPLLETSDYDYVVDYEQNINEREKVSAFEKEILLDGQVLRINYQPQSTLFSLQFEGDTLATELQQLLRENKSLFDSSDIIEDKPAEQAIQQEFTGESMRVKIIWENIQGRKEKNNYKPEYLQARILLRISTKDLLKENG